VFLPQSELGINSIPLEVVPF